MDSVVKSWRLNERHYGALRGLNKAEARKNTATKSKNMEKKLRCSAASLEENDDRYRQDPRYADLDQKDIPLTESLKLTVDRFLHIGMRQLPQQLKAVNV